MPRPVKPRKVGFIPAHKLFVPHGKDYCKREIVTLKHEELEAIRLKDLENLHQKQCADIMEVSRQTFQLILESARTKIANALIKGQPLKVEGGDFIESPCKRRCRECGDIYSDHETSCCVKLRNQNKVQCPKCCHDK